MQKGKAGSAALLRLSDATTQPKKQPRASKYITMRQATNIMEAVRFAKLISFPLVAHLTVHWSLTDVGDDSDGKLFAKVREGLDKWLHRRGIAFAGAWARERQSGGQSDVVHCHLLFHLPVDFRAGKKLRQVEEAILRLVERHGCGVCGDNAIDLGSTTTLTANTSSKGVALRSGSASDSGSSIAARRASSLASVAAPRRTLARLHEVPNALNNIIKLTGGSYEQQRRSVGRGARGNG